MKRILIIGSNGAGKSTFSYRLAEKTGLPLVHLDKIYWHNNWEITPGEEFRNKVLEEAQKDSWIIEGNNMSSLHQRLPYAGTVFWFEFPPVICVFNIIKRELKYRNKVRPDMPDQCYGKFDLKFLKLAWNFNKDNHDRIENSLKENKHLKVIRFTNYRQVKKYLSNITNQGSIP